MIKKHQNIIYQNQQKLEYIQQLQDCNILIMINLNLSVSMKLKIHQVFLLKRCNDFTLFQFQIRIFHCPNQGNPKLSLQLNTDQDVNLLSKILKIRDTIIVSTSRKVNSQSKQNARIQFLATIKLEQFELIKEDYSYIKLQGQLIAASDINIQLHSSQTVIIDRTCKITIIKEDFSNFDMQLILNQEEHNQWALCIICQQYAKFCCQCSQNYNYVQSVPYKTIVKTLYNVEKCVKTQEQNWNRTFKALQVDIDKYKPAKLYIVSTNMIQQQLKQNIYYNNFIQYNQKIQIDSSIQSSDTNFSRIFQLIIQNDLSQQIQRFKLSLLNEDNQSAIGVDAEEICNNQLGAIDVVIISEDVLGFDKTQEIRDLLKENKQIKLLYADSDIDAKEYLSTMTGLIVLLKYPVYSYGNENKKVGQPYTEEDWKIFSPL